MADGVITIGCGFLMQIEPDYDDTHDIITNDANKNDMIYTYLYHDGTGFLGIKSKCIHGFIRAVETNVCCCSEDEFRLSEDEIKKLTDFIEKHNLKVTSKLKFLCNIFPQ